MGPRQERRGLTLSSRNQVRRKASGPVQGALLGRINHVLLPAHHLIQVDGAWMGSLFLADLAADLGTDDPMWAAFGGHVMEPVAPILGRRAAVQFLAPRAAAQAGKSA